MANIQNQNDQDSRKTIDLLPQFFRTEANRKFLQATLDQLTQPGVVEKISGYYGRKTSKSYKTTDTYISDYSVRRENYQFEPAVVLRDKIGNVDFYRDYNDFMNQLASYGVDTSDHSFINTQDSYAWDPHIDFDKFTNFREYYWMPNGPVVVPVRGQTQEVTSTYRVSLVDDGDNVAYVFDELGERNPTLKLYRGQTYRFEIDTPGYPFAFAVTRNYTIGNTLFVSDREQIKSGLFGGSIDADISTFGEFLTLPSSGGVLFEQNQNLSTLFPDGLRIIGSEGEDISNIYVEKGVIEFTIPANAPDRLFYISQNSADTSGIIRIANSQENTFLNVEQDILGKKTYTSSNGVVFTNGLKVEFTGNIEPAVYETGYYYVEGVGENIKLVPEKNLIIPSVYSDDIPIPFDSEPFDRLPFSDASSYAATKDYIVINRASLDGNPWARYNKWFHRDVLEKSFEYNGLAVDIDETQRAKRPIIEFEAGLKLFEYGTESKQDIDLIDTFTTDAFSTIEGTIGYNIDGVDLSDGMRVLFAADTDQLVNGKIYIVKFVTISGARQISLIPSEDTDPLENQTVFVRQGNKNSGKTYYYDGLVWRISQEKTSVNQPPLFDLCCPAGNFYGNLNVFDSSRFSGTKIFSYVVGNGSDDPELNFPLSYKNIENTGDISFEFNLLNDSFTVQTDSGVMLVNTRTGNLRKYKNRTEFDFINGYSSTPIKTEQKVVRQYNVNYTGRTRFEIDVYDNAGDLNQLKTYVYVNNMYMSKNSYSILRENRRAYIVFNNRLNENDVVVIKTSSEIAKNNNGYYEFPINLEKNPNNSNPSVFTLGEIIEHVSTIIEDLPEYSGDFLGKNNMRDLGNIKYLGKRFIKHTGPMSLAMYHITNRDYSVVKSIEFSKKEYSKFKRLFLEKAETLGFDGPIQQHVDNILIEMNREKTKDKPFYFSDMVGYSTGNVIEYEVLDPNSRYYALSDVFDLSVITNQSINIYLNGVQLLYKKHYEFSDEGFAIIQAGQKLGDKITIVEYSSTDGSYIPPTPTKLGLYPKFTPEILIDDTYQTEEPNTTGPFKIYGQIKGTDISSEGIGWIYPVYTTKSDAQDADTNNQSTPVNLRGLSRTLYSPSNSLVIAAQDNEIYPEFPVGYPFIRGHDGSFMLAFKDYRDQLYIEYEKRVYNNIKVEHNNIDLDYTNFIPGKFRKTPFTREQINRVLLKDFVEWLRYVDNDYTVNDFYNRDNQYTYNYSNMTSDIDGELLPGFWRAVYRELYDTDSPHTRPWEMIGFSEKPEWWEQTYGPAPYTSNNLVLWQDLEQGIVREPNKALVIKNNYTRPGLMKYIPVDNQGELKTPIEIGYAKNFFFRYTTKNFVFGDHAPVETAWRRSSEYPFAILRAWLLYQPAKVFGTAFDVSRIQRNLSGQLIYSETRLPIQPESIVFPNTYADNQRINSSGLVNYVYNLVASDVLKVYQDYKDAVNQIQVQVGLKLGGFTDKSKIKFILDSRSPAQSNNGGVFVPEENYQIFLNTSSPTETMSYSGVIIEKTSAGFVVRGYNNDNPVFNYYPFIQVSKDITVTVGGVAEQTVLWGENKPYFTGQIVEFNSEFYRVNNNFTSGTTFSIQNLSRIPEIPIVGGRRATFRSKWDKRQTKSLFYGALLPTVQDVVDFLLGYGEYLAEQGFVFDYFNPETNFVENWNHSAREFMFWTTQNWSQGTTLILSPAANQLKFYKQYAVVDDVFDDFYDYSILKEDGLPLERKFNNILREGNNFGISSVNTDSGIYNISLPLVQKEHVVVFDNKTIFDDIIYQPETGYKQDRIRVSGYRSDNWNGGLNIPGFFYDDAKILQWEAYQDYPTGQIVKYKEFYYVALEPVSGTQSFVESQWSRLNEKPESKLYANFDYRINQFADFYDLDTDNFDSEQQRLAQHIIGYQKRKYLENIVNDDISQYKFYQGFIQDKGTLNAVEKLFGKLSSSGETGLQLYEEWAIQLGQYGSVDNIEHVEYNIDENLLTEEPQTFELIDKPSVVSDKIYRILPHQVYDKPDNYNHKPFPTTNLKKFTIDSGYVNEEDVQIIFENLDSLEQGPIDQVENYQYVWVIEDKATDWDVYQQIPTSVFAISAELNNTTVTTTSYEIVTENWAENEIFDGDYIAIRGGTQFGFVGFYQVQNVYSNRVIIKVTDNENVVGFEQAVNRKLQISKLRSVRSSTVTAANLLLQDKISPDQYMWIDNYRDGDWAVIKNSSVYSLHEILASSTTYDSTIPKYTTGITTTRDNRNMFISSPDYYRGIVHHYGRTNESDQWVEQNRIETPSGLYANDTAKFGESISVSEDGKYLAVGIPHASEVLTRYRGLFNSTASYNKNDIVKYKESLWQANRTILPQVGSQTFDSFDSYVGLASAVDDASSQINLMYTGNPGLPDTTVDHILLRPPITMFQGSSVGDTVVLEWNAITDANNNREEYLPWNDEISEISESFIKGSHIIHEKIEKVLFVEQYIALPQVGQKVKTKTGSATVNYVATQENSIVIYISEIKGIFNLTDDLLFETDDFIGFYNQDLTFSSVNQDTGFWMIKTPTTYNNGTVFSENGRGLVYVDYIKANETRDQNYYYNILDSFEQNVDLNENQRTSYISHLTFRGEPGPNGVTDNYKSDLFVIRAEKNYTDNLSVGQKFKFYLYDLDNRGYLPEDYGFTFDITNKEHEIYDLWDGYIDFDFTRFDFSGLPYEPSVGDIIEDVQTSFDVFGQLSTNTSSTSTAQVMFYQRNFNTVRVFVKVLSGQWQLLNNTARFEIRRKANAQLRGSSDVDRVIGQVYDYVNDIVVENDNIGKLIVVKNSVTTPEGSELFPIVDSAEIKDQEYYFYSSTQVDGIFRESNPPHSSNLDYIQVYNIPATEFGLPSYDDENKKITNEGAVALYKKVYGNFYELQTLLTSEYRTSNRGFGNKVKITKNNGLYTLFVGSIGDEDSSRTHPGSIEVFKHGYSSSQNYVGKWVSSQTYLKNDIVEYFGDYYRARNDIISQNEFSIQDRVLWEKVSWKVGKDDKYRGEFDSSLPYTLGDVVYNPDQDSTGAVSRLYRAVTNISAGNNGPTNNNQWKMITDGLDYLGYLPNLTNNTFYDYVTFDQNSTYAIGDLVEYNGVIYSATEIIVPSSIETERGFDINQWSILQDAIDEQVFDPAENIDIFSRDFDISRDGEILVVSSKQFANDSSVPLAKVLIYRLSTDKYILTQTIDGPSGFYDDKDFGKNVKISPDGSTIAITERKADVGLQDQGSVYLYKQIDGVFQFTQVLTSPTPEQSEMFGNNISFADDYLVVSSKYGDMKIPTTFDTDVGTTFDSGFTTFRRIKKDTGQVYIYENVNDYYLYSEKLRYDDAIIEFGENIHCSENHIYVGMPSVGNQISVGVLLDYRKEKNIKSWNEHRTLVKPVDVSKIRKCYLYNKKTNTFIIELDVIDPIQGKIASPAEQNLTYKTTYDPAYYNSSTTGRNPDVYWGSEHVGQLWWDISAVRFQYPYQEDIGYQKQAWNKVQDGKRLVVCEWTESQVLPSEWDRLSATPQGNELGITGTTLYGDDKYSVQFTYDTETKNFVRKYYFWVRNSRNIPADKNRNLSAYDVARLIAEPRLQGYSYLAITGDNRFILNNCEQYIYGNDVVLHISYTNDEKFEKNIHSQYQILSDGLDISIPNNRIERKWFDSLIGFDENYRPVPATNLPVKQKYGVQDKPRQSMFVNRVEALKQVIERVNLEIKKQIITDELDITPLKSSEQIPTTTDGFYDVMIDSNQELRTVSTNKVRQAVLEPVIENGKIIRVNIIDSGRGYKYSPNYVIAGSGSDAELDITINNLGEVSNVKVVNSGYNYSDNTLIIVRRFAVLVTSDENLRSRWSIYQRNETNTGWDLTRVQSYNVNLFWEYVDWYADGYNEFTEIDYVVESSYQLFGLNDKIGDIVKINNVGSGGWLLLEKISNVFSEDYTVNYKTVGRENGTIQFSDTIYNYGDNVFGYDNRSYDSYFYDSAPAVETRIILKTIRDVIFTGSRRKEYNQLFISSLRYVLNEQKYVDWLFKTSFIKLKHDLGELTQDITFNSDKIKDYQDYVKEVKPYKTVIREFINGYNALDESQTSVTDFDLAPWYRESLGKILPSSIKVSNNQLNNVEDIVNQYPRKHWLDNFGYSVSDVVIGEPGSGYTIAPQVIITGGGGTGATAVAYIGYGKVTSIKVTNPGSGYTSSPEITLEGSIIDGGHFAKATAVLGPSRVRKPSITIKFDRIGSTYLVDTLDSIETFTGTGSKFVYDLEWPMNTDIKTVKITVNGRELLRSEYKYQNKQNKNAGYTRMQGNITFTTPPSLDSEIVITYKKNISMLSAADRIRFGYKPVGDMLGADLGQLMDGVDYGGVEIRSFDFGTETGWDTNGWYTDTWDTFDSSYTDLVFTMDGSTALLSLEQPLEQDTVYNVYLNGIRIDDPYYGTAQQTNDNAIISTLTGDGSSSVIDLDDLGISVSANDVLIIRKIESDGSYIPQAQEYDTDLSGGNLSYSTATGLLAEDIIVDGDGFVTPTTSGGPEELVPGQVFDTLDIQVETQNQGGQGRIYVQNFAIKDETKIFALQEKIDVTDGVVVKVNNIILDKDNYTLDLFANTVEVNDVTIGDMLSVVIYQVGYNNFVDVGSFVADGSTHDYTTSVEYNDDVKVTAFVNGSPEDVVVLSDDETGDIVLRFFIPPTINSYIYYIVTTGDVNEDISYVNREVFVADGSTTSYTLSRLPYVTEPYEDKIIVKKNNTILHSAYNIEHIVEQIGNQLIFIENFQKESGSLQIGQIDLYLNDIKMSSQTQWIFNASENKITVYGENVSVGDSIKVYIYDDIDYRIVNNNIVFEIAPETDDIIEIFTFSNHAINSIERYKYTVVNLDTLIKGTEEYYSYNNITKGIISLRKQSKDVNQFWVNVNGIPLTPSIDFYLSQNGMEIVLANKPTENDVIDVIQFSGNTSQSSYKYRQFKDMLNRTHYKVIDDSQTKLAQDLNWYDVSIVVDDASKLADPDKTKRIPGVVFIDAERIEYFVKQGNTLKHIRRGTLGTGVKEKYIAGTSLIDQGTSKTIPYKDNTRVQQVVAGQNTTTIALDFTPESINEIEVFVAGRRLNKTQISVYDSTLGLDSPTADRIIPPEFTWQQDTNSIVFEEAPVENTSITILRKTGKMWNDSGKSLADSDTDIRNFLINTKR